jgi:hypothetical protein
MGCEVVEDGSSHCYRLTATLGLSRTLLTSEQVCTHLLCRVAVHTPFLLAQLDVGGAIATSWMRAAEPALLCAQGPVPVGLQGLLALGGPLLADHLARPPL